MFAEGDTPLGVVAQSCSADCSVEPKRVVNQSVLLKKIHGQLNYFCAHRHRLAQGHYLLEL